MLEAEIMVKVRPVLFSPSFNKYRMVIEATLEGSRLRLIFAVA